MDAYRAITSRRSQRQFDGRPVPLELVRKLLYAGCLVPAPHHTHPWRFVPLDSRDARDKLATAMGAAWRQDLEGDGVAAKQIDAVLERSRRQIEDAPALVLCGIVADGLREWPDEWKNLPTSLACFRFLCAHSTVNACPWSSLII